jgi:4-alpha-glucanotransferase
MIHDPFPIHYSPFSISHFLTFLFWANTHRYQVTEFGLPGMRILQFGFSSPSDPFLPHNYIQHCVAYTGTHDNDTALGWLATASQKERDLALRYLHSDGHDFAWDLIRGI